MKKHKKIVMIACFIGLLFLLTGVTYSFFNYTRIGQANSFRVGRINFSTTQNGSISLTNVFPITSDELDDDVKNHDSVSISITGDTTYAKGIEYLVSFVEVNNVINNRRIPVSYTVNSTNLGIPSGNYYDDRGSTTSVYFHNDGVIKENKYILVGYIASGETGINGSVTITAYVDANQIAITDTLVEDGPNYQYNGQATAQDISICANYIESLGYTMDQGSTYESFCQGMGTSYNSTIINYIENQWFYLEEIEYLMEHNIIIDTADYTKRTTKEWVNGRTVFTTDEWSSLKGNNALSFKIKIEANEGIWVEEEATQGRCFTTSKPEKMYVYNDEMTQEEMDACIDYFVSDGWGFDEDYTAADFCNGTGTYYGYTIQEHIYGDFYDHARYGDSSSVISSLEDLNVIKSTGKYKTSILDYDSNCGDEVIIPKKMDVSINNYQHNDNITSSEISTCVDYMTNYIGATCDTENGETMESFCAGTGNMQGNDFQYYIENNFYDDELEYLAEHNIIVANETIIKDTTVFVIGGNYDLDNDIYYGAFENKGLKSVIIPKTITTIRERAFIENELTGVSIPSGVKVIEQEAFDNNYLATLDLGNTVREIKLRAFSNNNLTSITLPNSINSLGANVFNNNPIITMTIDITRINGTAGGTESCTGDFIGFDGLNQLETVIFGEHAEIIGVCSFYEQELDSVVLSNSVERIDYNAFNSSKINSLNLSNSVTNIGQYAFYYSQINSLNIPNSVTSIGANAFANSNFTSITIGNGIESIGRYAFVKSYLSGTNNNANLASITIDKSCSYIKSMVSYPWIGSDYRAGTTIYGSNNEICDSW